MRARLDTDKSAKRPFKGKGAQRPIAATAWPCINNARDASHWFEVLDSHRTDILTALHALQQHQQYAYDAFPFALVRRRSGGLLWRKRSGTPQQQTLFELLSPTGLALLQTLSLKDQRHCLDLEAERLRLNLHWTLVNSACLSLRHYLNRYTELRHRRKSLPTE
jgi:hypothetical protein